MLTNLIFAVVGFVLGALSVAIILKSKNSSLETQIEIMKEQEIKNEDMRNKDIVNQINIIKNELQNTTEKLLVQRESSLLKSNNIQLDAVLNPLKNEIEIMRKSMTDNIKTSVENKASLEKAIEELMKRTEDIGNDANNLAKALKNESKTQGNWGELILENILEKSGLTKGEHYEIQSVIKDAFGNKILHEETSKYMIPDVVVHYPDNKDLIIDSKVSLSAFVDYCSADDDSERNDALKRHILSLRQHYKELQKKNYSSYIKQPRVSLNYVIMFVPNESALQVALYEDNKLWREAFENGVFITSEQNLLALLRMIQLAWTQVKQAKNQNEIFMAVNKLLEKINDFIKKYEEVGKKISTLQSTYDDAKKKLYSGNQSVIKSAAKVVEISGTGDSKMYENLLSDCE